MFREMPEVFLNYHIAVSALRVFLSYVLALFRNQAKYLVELEFSVSPKLRVSQYLF